VQVVAVLGVLAGLGLDVDPAGLDQAHHIGVAVFDRVPPAGRTLEELSFDVYPAAFALAAGVPAGRAAEAGARLFGPSSPTLPWTQAVTGSIAALRPLASTGVKLAIVSNSNGTVQARLADLGICQVGPGQGVPVGAILDSEVVGVAKPDPAIFELALAAIGAPAGRAVHVGDSVRIDVEGARAAGLRALHFDPFGLCQDGGHQDVAALTEVPAVLGLDRGGRVGNGR
jgi:putative hydrolase of the HAD superfamily